MKAAIFTERPPLFGIVRRHRCEICHEVFECWLCKVGYDHRMHGMNRIQHSENDATIAIFVCEECVVSDNHRYVRGENDAMKHGEQLSAMFWDYLTGERVEARDIGRGSTRRARKENNRKNFIRMHR